jgi:hypothetical protein
MISFMFERVADGLEDKEVGQLVLSIITFIPLCGEKLKWLDEYYSQHITS